MMLDRDTLWQLLQAHRSEGIGLHHSVGFLCRVRGVELKVMPAKPSYRLIAGILALILSNAPGALAAPRVEVFTDRDRPVTRTEAFADLKIYRLDGLVRAQQRLSAGLPANASTAAKIAGERFEALRSTLAPQMMEAGEGLVQAFHNYRLERYPAIVFNGKAVIYGVTDLAVARRLYESGQRRGGGR